MMNYGTNQHDMSTAKATLANTCFGGTSPLLVRDVFGDSGDGECGWFTVRYFHIAQLGVIVQ